MNDYHEMNEEKKEEVLEEKKEEVTQEEKKEECSKKKVCKKTPCAMMHKVLLIIAAVIVGVAALFAWVYASPVDNGVGYRLSNILPLPAAVIGSDVVPLNDFYKEHSAIKRYLASENSGYLDGADVDIVTIIMETLINKSATRQISDQYGLTVDEAVLEERYQTVVGTVGEEEAFLEEMTGTFGWDKDEFLHYVIEPLVLAEALTEYVDESDEMQQDRYDEAASAREQILEGANFDEIATAIHTSYDIGQNGDYGYIASSLLPSEWSEALEGVEEGEVTEVLDGAAAFFLLKVSDTLEAWESESGEEEVYLYALTVPKLMLQDVIDAYLQEVRVWQFVGEDVVVKEEVEEGEEEHEELEELEELEGEEEEVIEE